MKILTQPISIQELAGLAKNRFGTMIKCVVDIEKRCMAIDADMHADEEAELISQGSQQESLWGINLYPEFYGTDDFIEFDSMINLRPSRGNVTRGVDNPDIQTTIRQTVKEFINP